MTYNARETSTYQGTPIFLYRFTRSGVNYDYCNLPEDLVLTTPVATTFAASPITHGSVFVGQSVNRDQLEINFPLTDPFASLFLSKNTTFAPTTVTIWRRHYDDPDDEFRVVFKGKVRSGKPSEESQIILVCAGLIAAVKQSGIGNYLHRSCRHSLYFGECRLNKADFQIAGTVTAISGTTCTIAEADLQPDGYYLGGILEYGPSQIFIINHVGNQLTLRYIPTAMQAEIDAPGTASVNIAPGCDKSLDTCIDKFNNLDNFGGFWYMPEDDPWNDGSIV